MTTPLKHEVVRVSCLPHRGKKLIVSLLPGDCVGIRQERSRKTEVVSLAAIYDFCIKQRVATEKWNKTKRKGTTHK